MAKKMVQNKTKQKKKKLNKQEREERKALREARKEEERLAKEKAKAKLLHKLQRRLMARRGVTLTAEEIEKAIENDEKKFPDPSKYISEYNSMIKVRKDARNKKSIG